MEEIDKFIKSLVSAEPTFVIFLILAAIALSGKLSVNISRIILFVAWMIGSIAFRNQWLLLGPFTIFIILIGAWARPEAVPRYFGRITPRRKLLFAPSASEDPELEIGDSGAVLVWKGPAGQPLIRFFDKSQLTVERIRGRVMVSTKVINENGDVVAEIIRNEWRAPPPNAWDRNYTSDAVEVKDSRGKIVLQVRALHGRIQIQGEWWGNANHGLRIVQSSNGHRKTGQITFFGPNAPPGPPEIEPMFAYPSETNLGKLVAH